MVEKSTGEDMILKIENANTAQGSYCRYHQAKDRAFLLIAKVGFSGSLIFYDSMLPDGGC